MSPKKGTIPTKKTIFQPSNFRGFHSLLVFGGCILLKGQPTRAQRTTPRKFNNSPMKNGGWKTILSSWVLVTVQGRTVKLREGIHVSMDPGRPSSPFWLRGIWCCLSSLRGLAGKTGRSCHRGVHSVFFLCGGKTGVVSLNGLLGFNYKIPKYIMYGVYLPAIYQKNQQN